MSTSTGQESLDAIDHIAISVRDVRQAVDWYTERFKCRVRYQDQTWALLEFGNIKLAMVSHGDHPPHIGFMRPDAARFGTLALHRDGTRFVYLEDPFGNAVEILQQP